MKLLSWISIALFLSINAVRANASTEAELNEAFAKLQAQIADHSSGPMMTQEIRNFADIFAELFIKKKTAYDSGNGLINQEIAAQLELYRSMLAGSSVDYEKLFKDSYDRMSDFKFIETREYFDKMRMTASLIFLGMTAGPAVIFADTPYFKWALLNLFIQCNFVAYGPQKSPFMLLSRLAMKMAMERRHRGKFMEAFFGRIAELGIVAPKNQRETWILSQLDGNPVTDWAAMSNSEKIEWSRKFVAHLNAVADVTGTVPEVQARLRELASNLNSKIPTYTWWRSRRIRDLSVALGSSFRELLKIHESHPVLSNPAEASFLYANFRDAYDYSHLMADEKTKNLFLESRISMPSDLSGSLERIESLGGKIQVNWEHIESRGRVATYDFKLSISFSDGTPAIEVPARVKLENTAADHRWDHLTTFPKFALDIRAALQQSLTADGVVLKLKDLWDIKNPEKACSSALSVVDEFAAAATP